MPETRHTPDRDPERTVRDYAGLVLRVCYTYLRSTADACHGAGRRRAPAGRSRGGPRGVWWQ